MTKTLDTATHITRVFEIFETCQAHSCIWTFNTSQVPILYCFHWVAFLLMKSGIILLALCTTIWNTHASTVNTKLLNFKAVLALCNNLHVFIIFGRVWSEQKLFFISLNYLDKQNIAIWFLIFLFFTLFVFRFFPVTYDLVNRMIYERIQAISFDFNLIFALHISGDYLWLYELKLWNRTW
jgi:hypothetical protein